MSSYSNPQLKPTFDTSQSIVESSTIKNVISTLKMLKHPEGGYFVETDRDANRVTNPFINPGDPVDPVDSTRNSSTTIHYLLTPGTSFGAFHRNKGRTVHTLHRGRGRYIIIHADEAQAGHEARVEIITVGQNIEKGEKLQWIVDGGKFKSSFLLPDESLQSSESGLLISEVTCSVPVL